MSVSVHCDTGLGASPSGHDEPETATWFVAALVASAFRVPAQAIRSDRRGPADVAFARQVIIYLSHTRLGLTYAVAGRCFGRDRTTAAHACRTVEDRREDPRVDAILDWLERAIDNWRGLPPPARTRARR
jgi:hypothetical protein